jgi:hypothetical protein
MDNLQQFSLPLNPEQVSEAWLYLFDLSQNPEQQIPESLQELTNSDWFLLNNLLMQELAVKQLSKIH